MQDDYYIGIDLGGTKIYTAVVGRDLTVHYRSKIPAPHGGDEVISAVSDAIKQAIAKTGLPIKAVGCGIPCLIDRNTGRAVMAVNLDIEDVDFARLLSQQINLPVTIDNDANVSALAEHRHGAAKGCSQVVMLTVGTGIGGGLIINGEIYRGADGAAAELGHMTIEVDGPPCQGNCPNHGCLESLASGTALKHQAMKLIAQHPYSPLAQSAAGAEISGEQISAMALDGDPLAIEAFRTIGNYLGVGITNYINIFNPEVVVIGGGVSEAGELLLGPAREVVNRRGLRPSRDTAQLRKAKFGPEAGMIGAATLAMEWRP